MSDLQAPPVTDLPATTRHDLERLRADLRIDLRVVAADFDSTTVVLSHDQLTALANAAERLKHGIRGRS